MCHANAYHRTETYTKLLLCKCLGIFPLLTIPISIQMFKKFCTDLFYYTQNDIHSSEFFCICSGSMVCNEECEVVQKHRLLFASTRTWEMIYHPQLPTTIIITWYMASWCCITVLPLHCFMPMYPLSAHRILNSFRIMGVSLTFCAFFPMLDWQWTLIGDRCQ